MQIETQAFAPTNGVQHESDVESLCYLEGNLDVILACSKNEEGTVHGLKIHFSRPLGFRFLDEADLARYWISEGFVRGSHLLEVKNGGWAAEEDVLRTFETERREWLVVSGNACVSVFCLHAPELMDVSWKYGSRAL